MTSLEMFSNRRFVFGTTLADDDDDDDGCGTGTDGISLVILLKLYMMKRCHRRRTRTFNVDK